MADNNLTADERPIDDLLPARLREAAAYRTVEPGDMQQAADEIDSLRQFRDWATPQLTHYAEQRDEIESLTAERDHYKLIAKINHDTVLTMGISTHGDECGLCKEDGLDDMVKARSDEWTAERKEKP